MEMRIYARCCELLREWGVTDRDCCMVLFGMCDADTGYAEALAGYAEYRECSKEIMHSRICYALLAAGVEVRPGTLFRFLKWKGERGGED